MLHVGRRQFLKLISMAALWLGIPWGRSEAQTQQSFFTSHEHDTLQAALARLIPTDKDPGATEANVVNYIENMLTAFDHDPPLVYSGGPFSNRNPFPDNQTGTSSNNFPANALQNFVPLSRVKALAWKVRLFGSKATAGGSFNDAVLGPVQGLRDFYKEGLQALDTQSQQLFRSDFVTLSPDRQDQVLQAANQNFISQLMQNAIEGMYGPPEYGGNQNLVGWRYIHFLGDSQPLGYSIFNASNNSYNERPGYPVSTPDSASTEVPATSPEMQRLLKELNFIDARESLEGRSLSELEARFKLSRADVRPWRPSE
jgi:hypothetical protein